jgi:hypothetical protein
MDRLFILPGARRPHPDVATWLAAREPPLGELARDWFALIRAYGPDVSEVMHDGQATACIDDAAFAWSVMR